MTSPQPPNGCLEILIGALIVALLALILLWVVVYP